MEISNPRFNKLLEMLEEQPDDLFLKYAVAMEYLGIRNLRKAEQLFAEVISTDEHYVSAYYQLGKIYEQDEREQEAIRIFNKGLEEAIWKKDQKTANEFRTAIEELTFD